MQIRIRNRHENSALKTGADYNTALFQADNWRETRRLIGQWSLLTFSSAFRPTCVTEIGHTKTVISIIAENLNIAKFSF